MKVYMTNTFTSIFPFGIIAKGEILEEKHLDALGEATIADMVARKALKVIDVPDRKPDKAANEDSAGSKNPQNTGHGEAADADKDSDGQNADTDEEGETDETAEDGQDDEEDEPEEIDMDAMDEVVGDQPAEVPAEPADAPTEKPASRRKNTAKKDKGGKQK